MKAISNKAVTRLLFLWQYLPRTHPRDVPLPKEKRNPLCELCASSEAGGETFFFPSKNCLRGLVALCETIFSSGFSWRSSRLCERSLPDLRLSALSFFPPASSETLLKRSAPNAYRLPPIAFRLPPPGRLHARCGPRLQGALRAHLVRRVRHGRA